MRTINQVFIVLMILTTVYGATIGAHKRTARKQADYYSIVENSDVNPEDITVQELEDASEEMHDNVINLNVKSEETNKNAVRAIKFIVQVAKGLLELVSKMDVSEKELQKLIQLMYSFAMSINWGPYTQVVVPVISGMVFSMIKSLS